MENFYKSTAANNGELLQEQCGSNAANNAEQWKYLYSIYHRAKRKLVAGKRQTSDIPEAKNDKHII